jgi:heme/copper-type cytochrome/quinol oxidase subunit 3
MQTSPEQFPQHMFQAAVEFAILAIRTLILINGAAVIALLTFVGQVWANDQHNGSAMAKILFWPLLFFLTGLILAVVTCLLAYLTQMITTERGGGSIPPASKRLRLVAIMTSVLSITSFTAGAVLTATGVAG